MRKVLIGLTLVPQIGWKTIHTLVQQGIDEQMLGWQSSKWKDNFPFLSEKQCLALESKFTTERVHKALDKWEASGIKVTTVYDPIYPEKLKNIYDPPWVLPALK